MFDSNCKCFDSSVSTNAEQETTLHLKANANATFSSGNAFAFEPKPGMHVSMNVCVVSVCHYWLLRVIDLLFDACLHLFSL